MNFKGLATTVVNGNATRETWKDLKAESARLGFDWLTVLDAVSRERCAEVDLWLNCLFARALHLEGA